MKSARNGRCTRNERIAVSIVGGDFSIVARSSLGKREMAAKVSAMFVNSTAWVWATGAAWAEARPSWRKNWSSCVSGSARLRITGVRLRTNGLSDSIARFNERPLPAKASPKPAVARRTLGLVSRSNIE